MYIELKVYLFVFIFLLVHIVSQSLDISSCHSARVPISRSSGPSLPVRPRPLKLSAQLYYHSDFTPSGKRTDLLCVFSTRDLLLQGSICQTRDSKTCTPSFGRKHVWSGGWGKVMEGGDDFLSRHRPAVLVV